MDNKEEQIAGNDDGSPNLQGVNRPQGLNGVVQMPIQQQQQTHMVNQARTQRSRPYQQFDHGAIAGPGRSGSRMQALSNMQEIPNMGHQLGISRPYRCVLPGNPVFPVAYHRRRVEPYMRAMHFGRFGGLSCPISVSNSMSNDNEITQQLQQLTLSSALLQSGALTDGQPDLQRETQEPVASGSTQSDDPTLIQQKLLLLFHVYKCQLRERQANGEGRICALPQCKTMKNVLTHMTTCEEGKKCTTPHCSTSKQIITHWKKCQKSDCPVCLPIKQADKNKSAISRADVTANQPFDTMGITQGQNNTAGILSNEAVGHDVRMPRPGMQGHPGSLTAGIRLAQLQAQQSPGQSVVNQGQPIAPNVSLPLSSDPTTVVVSTNQPALTTGPMSALAAAAIANLQQQDNMLSSGFQSLQPTKEWHQSVTPNVRNHLVHKVVQAMFPAPDPHLMFDKRLHTVVAYAKKAEGDVYEMADSKLEYYHSMADEIYKTQKSYQEMQLAVNSRL
ncbi:histone acetyltransferase p300-like isoform X2 [Microplitis mediator]|uniref:histone acetyltransferase p300-like isoform X2 n=1 Tax=Microplitis mediator TaxID=375433 RepID=UPI002556C107|nr:histone acetyltransferase p300-like isoform X2 [Microplitis mediator]